MTLNFKQYNIISKLYLYMLSIFLYSQTKFLKLFKLIYYNWPNTLFLLTQLYTINKIDQIN